LQGNENPPRNPITKFLLVPDFTSVNFLVGKGNSAAIPFGSSVKLVTGQSALVAKATHTLGPAQNVCPTGQSVAYSLAVYLSKGSFFTHKLWTDVPTCTAFLNYLGSIPFSSLQVLDDAGQLSSSAYSLLAWI